MRLAGQMCLDDRVDQGQVLTIRSPRVGRTAHDDGAPSRLPAADVLPPSGVHVIAPGEQRPGERSWPPATSGRPPAPGWWQPMVRGRSVGSQAGVGGAATSAGFVTSRPSSDRNRRFSARRRSISRRSSAGLAAVCLPMHAIRHACQLANSGSSTWRSHSRALAGSQATPARRRGGTSANAPDEALAARFRSKLAWLGTERPACAI